MIDAIGTIETIDTIDTIETIDTIGTIETIDTIETIAGMCLLGRPLPLKPYAYPETERVVGGIGVLVVDANGAVDNTAVDEWGETIVGSDGEEIVDRGTEAER